MPVDADAALLDLLLAIRGAVERDEPWRHELGAAPVLLDVDELGVAFDLAGATYGVVRRGDDPRSDVFWRERRTSRGLLDAQLFDFTGRVLWRWHGLPLGSGEPKRIVREICARPVFGDPRWS